MSDDNTDKFWALIGLASDAMKGHEDRLNRLSTTIADAAANPTDADVSHILTTLDTVLKGLDEADQCLQQAAQVTDHSQEQTEVLATNGRVVKVSRLIISNVRMIVEQVEAFREEATKKDRPKLRLV